MSAVYILVRRLLERKRHVLKERGQATVPDLFSFTGRKGMNKSERVIDQLSGRSAESYRHLFDLRPRGRIDVTNRLQKLRVRHGRTYVGPTLRLSLNHTKLLLFRFAESA